MSKQCEFDVFVCIIDIKLTAFLTYSRFYQTARDTDARLFDGIWLFQIIHHENPEYLPPHEKIDSSHELNEDEANNGFFF